MPAKVPVGWATAGDDPSDFDNFTVFVVDGKRGRGCELFILCRNNPGITYSGVLQRPFLPFLAKTLLALEEQKLNSHHNIDFR
jgi:hypothetical protein